MEEEENHIHVEDILKWTPLRFAEETSSWRWVEMFLQSGVPRKDLVVTKSRLSSPDSAADIVREACECGYLLLLNLALSVDPSLSDARLGPEEWTPLHVAVVHCQQAVVRLLLGAGADVEARNLRGRTPLHEAAARDAVASLRVLTEHGADVWAQDDAGSTAVQLARARGHAAASNLLDVSGGMQLGTRNLILAAEVGNAEAVRQLLPRAADLGAGEWTHLHWAALNGSATVVRTLLAAGLRADATDRHGNTALHVAAATGRLGNAAALLAAGASVDAADSSGSTALHYAVRTDNLAVARLLVEEGARLDQKDAEGQTPLHRAVARGSLDAVGLLLESGARRDVTDQAGRTPYDVARQLGYTEVVRCLRLSL